MCKRSITALVWLLIIAIPVQGVAAAAMTHCDTNHHSGAGAPQVDHALHDHSATGHGDSHGTAHQSGLDTEASGFEHDGYSKCSACAACCLGVGLPGSFYQTPPALPSVAANQSVFVSALEVVITGPERPPRIFLV